MLNLILPAILYFMTGFAGVMVLYSALKYKKEKEMFGEDNDDLFY